jgi:cytochrome bd-type quinol oxidase subunit 2
MSDTVKKYMTTTNNLSRNCVSTSALSIALLICSVLWLASACVFFATSGFKDNWSATPLFWMLLLLVTPAVCFSISIILVDARKHSRFSALVWSALLAALLPVSLGTLLAVWAVKVLFTMSGVSI